MELLQQWKLTYDDYCTFPEDGRRHEILDGEHAVTPAPTPRHQRAVRRLGTSLENFVAGRGLGEIFFAPIDVVLSESTVVQPDLLWISPERSHLVGASNLQGAPDLIVEVLSPATRRTDENLKRKLYERFGVREYWVVDLDIEQVKVWHLEGDFYAGPRILEAERGDVLATALLPGFSLPLRQLFA